MSDSIALSKVFRVFISSTFSDFINERNYLQQYIFPRLEELCREHGALFQPIDLRWGITDEATMGQQTIEICLNEVRQCSEITPRPSFLILLGDRYGWIPIPVRVDRVQFEASHPTPLMKEWYRLDSNSQTYCLRSRTGEYMDPALWGKIENRLRADWEMRGEAQISATHTEIINGLDVPWENRESICCFHRHLRDIPLSEKGAPYSDLLQENGAYRVDPVCRQKLRDLESYIAGLLPEPNLITYEISFQDKESLVQPFCEEIGRRLKKTVLAELDRIETINRQEAALTSECSFSSIVVENYVGQELLLSRVLNNISSGEGMTVVYGGRGKSAFCAALATRIKDRKVILRHVGVSLISCRPESLIESILLQLNTTLSINPLNSSKGLSTATQDLSAASQALKDKLVDGKTVLIIDAADRLPNAGLILKPLVNLSNVVVTTSDRRTGDVLEAPYIELLPPLNLEERSKLFDHLLSTHGRRLSDEQRTQMSEVLKRSESVEFVRLCAEYAIQLHSWDKPFTASGEREIAALIFDNLIHKQMHAPLLTKRMLTYISMGRNGVTLPDLIALLMRDRDVFDEFNRELYHPLCKEEIPVSVLSRLYYDLTPYLRHLPVMGTDVISFAFGCFKDLALEGGVDKKALENAIEYYAQQANHDYTAALSELPYLLLNYRGTPEVLQWFCRDRHLCRKFSQGLEAEVISDTAAMDDSPEALYFKRILMNRITDFRRCPEAIESVLQTETSILHPGAGAKVLGAMLSPLPFELESRSASRTLNPEISITGLMSWTYCTFSPDGTKLLATAMNGTVTLYNLSNGAFTRSEMPGTYADLFLYTCVESKDAILALEGKRLMRLTAPDFWNMGLEQSIWSEVTASSGTEYLALSGDLPVTYGMKCSGKCLELVQMIGDDEDVIPLDFLLLPSDINHIAVTGDGDIAITFISGAIAATSGLYDETTSGHALMCCVWIDNNTKIVAASANGRLFLFDAEGGVLEQLDLSVSSVLEQHIECMVYDSERKLLYLGHRCGILSVVSVADGFRLIGCLHSSMRMGILAMALSPDNSRLALGGRGNVNEAPLIVCDVREIVQAAEYGSKAEADRLRMTDGSAPPEAQVFDKNISVAMRAGDHWYYIYEFMGQADKARELYSAPLFDPSRASFITNAHCYAPCPELGLLFFSGTKGKTQTP